jgi:hypothetical protein
MRLFSVLVGVTGLLACSLPPATALCAEPAALTFEANKVELHLEVTVGGVPDAGQDHPEAGPEIAARLELGALFAPHPRLGILASVLVGGSNQDPAPAILTLLGQTAEEARAEGKVTGLRTQHIEVQLGVGPRLGDLRTHQVVPHALVFVGSGGIDPLVSLRLADTAEILADPGTTHVGAQVGGFGAHRLDPAHRISLTWGAAFRFDKRVRRSSYAAPRLQDRFGDSYAIWLEDERHPGLDAIASDAFAGLFDVGIELRPVGELGLGFAAFWAVGANIRTPEAQAFYMGMRQSEADMFEPELQAFAEVGGLFRATVYIQ